MPPSVRRAGNSWLPAFVTSSVPSFLRCRLTSYAYGAQINWTPSCGDPASLCGRSPPEKARAKHDLRRPASLMDHFRWPSRQRRRRRWKRRDNNGCDRLPAWHFRRRPERPEAAATPAKEPRPRSGHRFIPFFLSSFPFLFSRFFWRSRLSSRRLERPLMTITSQRWVSRSRSATVISLE